MGLTMALLPVPDALARVLEGEFGIEQRALRLEVITVAPGAHGGGVGRALHAALEEEAAKRSIRELHTVSVWRDRAMLGFLDRLGYALAPERVIERALGGASDSTPPAPNDYERLARDDAEVNLLTARDLEDIVRIDREITGRERRTYMQQALDEALRESGVRISLAARQQGALAGYLMARADLGDFGRTEPVAVIDTIGVAPDCANRGIGQALVAQLFTNLAAIDIERVETIVAPGATGLLGFFHGAGFAPAERLAFVKRL